MRHMRLLRPALIALTFCVLVFQSGWARAADRDQITAFLQVTGFDVALDSISLSAASAPQMLGIDPGAFGSEWTRLSEQVFDTAEMRSLAIDILQQTLSDAALGHAAAFYASDLGQRLVEVENASHMMDDDQKQDEGKRLVSEMVRAGDARLQELKRMNAAIGGVDSSLKALQEIQFRTLIAASSAGVVELRIDPDELRAVLAENEAEMRIALQTSALAGAAYTYRDFPDDEITAYTDALEDPLMKEVYELLNAVQFEIMANRFEVLAGRMAGMKPGQDI
ncbi:DUF2059 domain-containing protein [Falsiphaeobacter marinintestinus]|uniref:DUF2059 domain-containing protein n=1 Tax=Falsiphaeobacter marinintestinus TaxID=1492905 RepID=UPI0011B56604|nr:DUF2059 domain-containing protein [Phaeobacter marinintestinus]